LGIPFRSRERASPELVVLEKDSKVVDPSARPDLCFQPGMNDAITIRPKPDRRAPDRLQVPPCRVCGLADHVVVLRTPYEVHLRCPECGDFRPLGKPRRELPEAVGQ